jgi:hypothetical protein
MTNESDNTEPESARGDYDVGYKKPPRHTQFPKGKSGNEAGRPKRALDIRKSLTEMLTEPVGIRIDGKARKVSTLEAGLLTLRTNLLKGDPQAFNTLIRVMNSAGMIRPAEDTDPDVSTTREDEQMLIQTLARFNLDTASKETARE